jgi:hypothetical protein
MNAPVGRSYRSAMDAVRSFVNRQHWAVQVAMLVLLTAVVTAWVFLRPTAIDNLASGDCIDTSDGGFEEVDCTSAAATYRIGGSCEVMLTLRAGGESGTKCAERVKPAD